jgi:serine/threonine protein phosphatase PrpC
MDEQYSNEWNQTTVEKIIMLMEEIAILESRYEASSGMGNINTAVSVLKNRVLELKGKIHG